MLYYDEGSICWLEALAWPQPTHTVVRRYLLAFPLNILRTFNPVITITDCYPQRLPPIRRTSSYKLTKPPDSESLRIAPIVVARNLSATSQHVQIQALEVCSQVLLVL